jgi:hypothetical protein
LASFAATATAAPVYPQMPAMPFQQRNLAHDVEDRNNPALVAQILAFGATANLALVFIKWRIIMCVLAPIRFGCINNINPANVHMYDALEIANLLNSTDMIMPNLSDQDVSTFNFVDLASTQMNTSSIHEQAVQQKHLIFTSLKTINQFEQSQNMGKHQVELKTGTVETQNPTLSIISRPYITFAPYFQFQWPMYRDLL